MQRSYWKTQMPMCDFSNIFFMTLELVQVTDQQSITEKKKSIFTYEAF